LQHKPELAANVLNFTSGEFFNPEDDPAEFFIWLEASIAEINAFDPTVVLYQAGADMHRDDPLGGILDDAQMRQRDRTVFRKVHAPIAWNLAGGYRGGPSIYEDPVLQTHLATLKEADESIGARVKRSL
jgi:acetoin utilization deacetylase AcuC-like enzyme